MPDTAEIDRDTLPALPDSLPERIAGGHLCARIAYHDREGRMHDGAWRMYMIRGFDQRAEYERVHVDFHDALARIYREAYQKWRADRDGDAG